MKAVLKNGVTETAMMRPMQRSDLETILEIEKTAFTDPWSLENFCYEFEHPFSHPLVLILSEKIIGYAVIWKIYENFHIANFAIDPGFQGKGFGTYFLEKLLELREKEDCAQLEVRRGNQRAISLYQKFGFEVIYERKAYYQNGEDALLMSKQLK